ncbi:MAG: Ig-like domain-containing protein [Gemmatimonadetes bacterium]|nr:Ig-like domain-containing protein [Gemmatimonadota bacterium]
MSIALRAVRARLVAFALSNVLILTAACGGSDSSGPSGPPAVAAVSISPPSASVVAGQTAQLTATATSSAGAVLTGRTASWTSADAGIATVSSAGLVTALQPGSTSVTATIEGRSGSATITVTAVPVAAVSVTAAATTVAVRTIAQATAVMKDASGNVLAGRSATWTSSDSTVVRVESSGSFVAVGAGTAQLTATSEGKSGVASITVQAGTLAYRGLYTQFERRGFPNGYYSGDAIKDFQTTDAFVPSLGLVKDEIARQLDAIVALGVNTITFELRSADSVLVPRVYPDCNVSPSTGLLFPRPPSADLDNLVAFFNLAQTKQLKVMLRLVNNRMESTYRTESTIWLDSILNRVKSHPALELVLFEGDQRTVDSNGDGTKDACGGLAEPPLNLGPDRPAAQYVQWAIGHAMELGIPARKLSAQAVLGAYVVDMELGAGANAQESRQWHPLGVMKTIFDRLAVPEDQRTYAVSFYQSSKCHIAAGYPCTDAAPRDWARETLIRAWGKLGYRTRSRMVAVEWGVVTPFPTGWNTDQAIPVGASLMRNFGLEGGSLWRWANFTNDEDADATTPYSIKWRGTAYNYTAARAALVQAYAQP